MKYISKIIALSFLLLLVAALGAIAEQIGIPLMETQGSPWLLGWGADDWPSYDGVYGLATSDRNSDGRDDLLVAGSYLHQFRLSTETGGATESYVMLPERFSFGEEGLGSYWVRALDINTDGSEDLVAITYTGTLRCFLAERTNYSLLQEEDYLLPPGSRNWLIEATGDEIVDLVVSSKDEGTWIYPGTQTGAFSTQPISSGIETAALYVTEGNLDGQPGLWMSNSEGLWFRTTSTTEVALIYKGPAWQLTAADLDGDGVLDLIFFADNILSVADTVNGFSLRQEMDFPFDPMRIAVGDFDGNGFDDLVLLQPPREYSYAVLLNHEGLLDENLWMRGVSYLEGIDRGVYEVVAGDFDGDGVDDVAFGLSHSVSFAVSSVGWRLVQPFGGTFLLGSTNEGLLVDGGSSTIAHLQHVGSGRFEREVLAYDESSRTIPYLAMFADAQGDKEEELITLSLGSLGGVVTVWEKTNDDWIVAWKAEVRGTIRPLLLAGNLIGNNKKEIVVAADSDIIIITPPESEIPSPYSSFLAGAVQRIDWGGPVGPLVVIPGDRDDEVVGFRVSDDVIQLQRLAGTQVAVLELTVDIAPLDLVTVDADGDKYLDLAVAGLGLIDEGTDEPKLVIHAGILYGNRYGQYGGEIEPIEGWPNSAFIFPYGGLLAEDLTGNGHIDLAMMRLGGEASTDGSLVYMFGQEDGSLQPAASYQDVGQRLLSIDINNDGIPDIAYTGQGAPNWLYIIPWKRGER